MSCTAQGTTLYGSFVQQESVFPRLMDDFLVTSSISCGHFYIFLNLFLCDVASIVLLLVAIVGLHSEFFSFGGY